MKIEKIKPIPKYMLKLIKKQDLIRSFDDVWDKQWD